MSIATERPDELFEILGSELQGTLGWVIIEDQEVSNTNAGGFTSGAWRTRKLNTTVFNNLGTGYSLAANQFTLPLGGYLIYASAPAFGVSRHATRLRNITDGSTELSGSSEFTRNASPNQAQTRSIVQGAFFISSSKTFELQHRCETTVATLGLGVATGSAFAVDNEVYSQVLLCKIF